MQKIKKYLILTFMILITIPDIIWGIYNLIIAGLIYCTGLLFQDRAVKLYGFNVAISVDQFFATKAFGQDPDITISMALGYAKKRMSEGTATVDPVWLFFAKLVNCMFWFQKDHVVEAIEHDEKMGDTVVKVHNSIQPTKIKKG